MDNNYFAVMDNLNQGILILNANYKITYANMMFSKIVKTESPDLLDRSILAVLPGFNTNYLRNAFSAALHKNYHFFFSAVLHQEIIPGKAKFNIRISNLSDVGEPYLLLEFQDVTSEYERIAQLKSNIKQLCLLNHELIDKEKQIQRLAYYDTLTGIANRALFYELAKNLVQTSKRKDEMFCLMFIDIDRFKCINDTYGHEVGDQVLKCAANIFTNSVRKSDIVARYGGDEFLILLPDIKKEENCKIVISKIKSAKTKTVTCHGHEIPLSFSIGVSFYPKDGSNIDQLIVTADHSMYRVKNQSRKSTPEDSWPVADWQTEKDCLNKGPHELQT